MNNENSINKFGKEYTDEKFWAKAKKKIVQAGKEVMLFALTLYYCLKDKDTPMWAKAVILGALGYFICTIDTLPDFIPIVGYTDDLLVLTAAITAVSVYVKSEHRIRAEETLHKRCYNFGVSAKADTAT